MVCKESHTGSCFGPPGFTGGHVAVLSEADAGGQQSCLGQATSLLSAPLSFCSKGLPGNSSLTACSVLSVSSETQSLQRGFPWLQTHLHHLEASPSTGNARALLCRLAPSAACPDAHTWLLTSCPERHQLESVKSSICFCGEEVLFLSEQPEPLSTGVLKPKLTLKCY